MRTLDENKMVAVEAGDWATANGCGICAAGIVAAGICWETLLAMLMGGAGEAVALYGLALVDACKNCLYGVSE